MGRLAKDLSRLLIEGGKVPADDVRAAVAGHSSVVGLLRVVQTDLSTAEWRGVGELSHKLADQPRVTDQPLTSVLVSPPSSEAGQLWRNVARLATTAQQEWQQSSAASRPFGPAAWSEIADIAAMAEAIGLLDGDIADSLNAVGRWREASDFRASQFGLIDIAQEVRRLAATGPLPTGPELKPAAVERIVPITTPKTLPDALHALSTLVASANNLPPAQIEQISLIVAEAAKTAAAALRQPADTAPSALLEHAKRLSAVTGYSRRIAPLRPGSGKALAQAQLIRQFIAKLNSRGVTLPPVVARNAASTLPSITQALSEAADRQVKTGLWLLSREGNGPLRWGVSLGSLDEPRMLDKLRRAASHAPHLAEAVDRAPTTVLPKKRPSPRPRTVLAGPLAKRGSPVATVQPWNQLRRGR
jgi:hypothetical protein